MRSALLVALLSAAAVHPQEPAKAATATTTARTEPAVVVGKTTVTGLSTEDMEAARKAGKAGATIAGVGIVTVLVLGSISFLLQLLPIVIAFARGHPNKLAITAVSLLLGWTCIGWVVALVWSLTAVPDRRRYR